MEASVREREGGIIYEPDGWVRPEYPRWLESKRAYVGGPYPPEQGQLFHPNETLPAWSKAVAGAGLLGLFYSIDHWARPLLKVTARQRYSGILGWLEWTLAQIERLVNPGLNYVGHEISKSAAHTEAGPARVLRVLAHRWEQSTWHLAYFAHEMAIVMDRLRHRVIPREIRKETRPLRHRVRVLERGLLRERRRMTALRRWIHRQLALHVYPQLRELQRLTRHTLPTRIGRAESRIHHLEHELAPIEKLVPRLAWVGAFAGAVPLTLYALRRLRLQSLLCRNTRDFTQELCRSPAGSGGKAGRFLRRIFGASFGLFLLTDICKWAGLAVALAGRILPKLVGVLAVAGAALCDGAHDPAPPLPLNAARLPTPRNPLPLS